MIGERFVTGHTGINDPSVQGSEKLYFSGPVLGPYYRFLGSYVGVAHMHYPAVYECGFPSLMVAKMNFSVEDTLSNVQFLLIGDDLYRSRFEPVSVIYAKTEGKPVGKVDQVFIFNCSPGDLCFEPVISSGQVGTGIMDGTGAILCRGTSCCKITVTEGAQGFTEFFFFRFVSLIGEIPGGHGFSPFEGIPANFSRKILTSMVFSRLYSAMDLRSLSPSLTTIPIPVFWRVLKASSSVMSSPI